MAAELHEGEASALALATGGQSIPWPPLQLAVVTGGVAGSDVLLRLLKVAKAPLGV